MDEMLLPYYENFIYIKLILSNNPSPSGNKVIAKTHGSVSARNTLIVARSFGILLTAIKQDVSCKL